MVFMDPFGGPPRWISLLAAGAIAGLVISYFAVLFGGVYLAFKWAVGF